MNDVIEQVLSELMACVKQVPAESLVQAGGLVESASRIFVAGAGRSGLCMKAFGMRLMHMGKTVHVVGETTTPGIAAGDLLVVGSGSGRTSSLLAVAGQAQSRGANILLFTTDAGSPLAKMADHRVVISAPSYKAYEGGVSRLHATIKIDREQVTITDLGSANGTRINGKKIAAHQPYSLNDEDILSLGKFKAQILIQRN